MDQPTSALKKTTVGSPSSFASPAPKNIIGGVDMSKDNTNTVTLLINNLMSGLFQDDSSQLLMSSRKTVRTTVDVVLQNLPKDDKSRQHMQQAVIWWIYHQACSNRSTIDVPTGKGEEVITIDRAKIKQKIIEHGKAVGGGYKVNTGDESGVDTTATIGIRYLEQVRLLEILPNDQAIEAAVAKGFVSDEAKIIHNMMYTFVESSPAFRNTKLPEMIGQFWLSFAKYYINNRDQLLKVLTWAVDNVDNSQLNPVASFVANKVMRNLVAKFGQNAYRIKDSELDREFVVQIKRVRDNKGKFDTKAKVGEAVENVISKRELSLELKSIANSQKNAATTEPSTDTV